MTSERVAIIGAGGHASAVFDILVTSGADVVLIVSPNQMSERAIFHGKKILRNDKELINFKSEIDYLVNGIGFVVNSNVRSNVHNDFVNHGFVFLTVISPHAYVSSHAVISNGVQIMHGAIVNTGAKIGKGSLINTGAIIEHDTIVGSHTHIGPGTTVCGGVIIGNNSYIGAGATIINSISIGNDVIIGAGAIVTQDVIENSIIYPARGMSKRLGGQ